MHADKRHADRSKPLARLSLTVIRLRKQKDARHDASVFCSMVEEMGGVIQLPRSPHKVEVSHSPTHTHLAKIDLAVIAHHPNIPTTSSTCAYGAASLSISASGVRTTPLTKSIEMTSERQAQCIAPAFLKPLTDA